MRRLAPSIWSKKFCDSRFVSRGDILLCASDCGDIFVGDIQRAQTYICTPVPFAKAHPVLACRLCCSRRAPGSRALRSISRQYPFDCYCQGAEMTGFCTTLCMSRTNWI